MECESREVVNRDEEHVIAASTQIPEVNKGVEFERIPGEYEPCRVEEASGILMKIQNREP